MYLVQCTKVSTICVIVETFVYLRYMKEITTEQVPIYIWAEEVDEQTLRQSRNIANLPITFHHVAIMPDAHMGFGMPIGGVLATIDGIVPNAVGVDIGCGMYAVRLNSNIEEITQDQLKIIVNRIRQHIPLGFEHHKDKRFWEGFSEAPCEVPIVSQELDAARYQLGTLGGGNH